MLRYALKTKKEKSAKAYGRSLNISTKNSVVICRSITGMQAEKGIRFLEDLIEKKRDIKGKYYTKTSSEILKILKSAMHNAEFKGLDTERLIIYATAHKGFTFYRPRNWKRRREKRKITNIQIVLVEK